MVKFRKKNEIKSVRKYLLVVIPVLLPPTSDNSTQTYKTYVSAEEEATDQCTVYCMYNTCTGKSIL